MPKKERKSEPKAPNNSKAVATYTQHDEDSNASTISNIEYPELPPVTMSNILQTYRQNPVGMFVGANLTNCTININMQK